MSAASDALAPPRRRRPLTDRVPPRVALAVLVALALGICGLYLGLDTPATWEYVLPLRAWRVGSMVLVAGAIAVSTVLFQTITANRVLTPGIMGFEALYVLVQTVAVFAFGSMALREFDGIGRWLLEVGLMVVLVVGLSRWLFFGERRSLHLLVLVGVVAGVLFRSLSSLLQRMLDPAEFDVLQDVFFASFGSVDRQLLVVSAVASAVVLAAIWPLRRRLDVLALGPDVAVGLGVDYRRSVMAVLVVVAVLVSVSTALVGPITFFGLLVANLAYLVVGERHSLSLPASCALGVITLVGGQIALERVFGFTTALSVVVEFLGGVVFLLLLLRRGAV